MGRFLRDTLSCMFEALAFGMFGLILGSFTNVLVLREETGETIGGRSHCPHCKRTLAWFELVPVLSYVLLRGRCRTCSAPISLQYPLVELLVALGVILIGIAPIDLIQKIFGIPIVLLIAAIAVYDLRTTYIPDLWSYCLALLASVYGVFSLDSLTLQSFAVFIAAGPLVALPLFVLWRMSQGRWMGFGDVKLVLSFGWILGVIQGFLALGLAFVLGAVVGLILIGITRFVHTRWGFTMKSEVPFGPFLVFALCLVWFSGLHGYDLASFFLRILTIA